MNGYEFSDIVVPEEINGKPVTKVDARAFKGITANSISLPDTIEFIGEYAFSSSVIKDGVNLPDGVTYIGEYAFTNYQNTSDDVNTSIVIPSGVKVINAYSFYQSNITDVKISEGVIFIGNNAFNATYVQTVDIPNSVLHINKRAFNTFNLKTINFGANVVNIGEFIQESFSNPNFTTKSSTATYSKLKTYPVEYNVSSDNKYFASFNGAVYNKNLTKLLAFPCGNNGDNFKFAESVKTICSYAFSNANNIENITIPYSVTSIDDYAFANTISLKSVFIPNSVSTIGEYAFSNGEALEQVEFDNDIYLADLAFAFNDCKALKSVIFGDNCYIYSLLYTFYQSGIEYIDLNCICKYLEGTFMESSIKEIALYEGIECIEYGTFATTPLERIVIPKTVTSIGGRAFEDCTNLSYVNLSNVQGLHYAAFKNCTSLESIDLTGVYYIYNTGDDYVFYGCTNLKKFYFTAEEKEAYIAASEFEGNENLETVVIGNSVTEIEDRAFANCVNLETAYIAEDVEEISDTAFENCDNLTIVCMYSSPVMFYAQKNNIPYETFVVSPIADQTYTGKAIKPALTVKQGGNVLTSNVDYTATYSDNVNVGKAKVVVTGLGDYQIFGSTANFNIVAPAHTHSYTSKVTKAATCASSGVKTYVCLCGDSYTETIKATGKHSYTSKVTKAPTTSKAGTMTYTCKTCNKKYTKSIAKLVKTSVSKTTAKSKGFTVSWKKVSSATGYQIQYSTNNKFSNAKTVTIGKNSTTSKTVTKLKSKKKYYVRVRTYRTINGKKYYSSWSTAKTVKTK